ncbi:hypothetical protein PFISCL1PPCAC_14703, partial [Pristionchus fissidentatus]
VLVDAVEGTSKRELKKRKRRTEGAELSRIPLKTHLEVPLLNDNTSTTMGLNRVRSEIVLICLLLPSIDSVLMYESVESDDLCLRAMCEVDSGCVPHGCDKDSNGRIGCGYFRLNIQQFRQCYQPGKKEDEEEELAWINCSQDYECSASCIKTLGFRFKVKCYGKSDCEAIARVHDGGANGCRARETAFYWKQVKQSCGQSCNKWLLKRH